MGGRGSGKTSAGAHWLDGLAQSGRCGRMAIIGPTLHDMREVMIEGVSGLRAQAHGRIEYEASRRRLTWPNGAQAFGFSAEDPESLRGPQFGAAWGDEFCYWARAGETLDALANGLRIGAAPRLVLTTTPRATAPLKALVSRSDVAVTQARTWDNAEGLSGAFIAGLNARWRGSAYERQELLGELIEDPEGALWKREALEALRVRMSPRLARIVVAVDPPLSASAGADACGIVAAGVTDESDGRRAVVLADASVQGAPPQEWAERAAQLAMSLGAHAIIAEANAGGELVRTVLRLAAPHTPVRLVHARLGKRARAMPIAALYAQGRVTHAGMFAPLEDEMCAFGAPGFSKSPDRLDALVWALTDLLLDGAAPRARML